MYKTSHRKTKRPINTNPNKNGDAPGRLAVSVLLVISVVLLFNDTTVINYLCCTCLLGRQPKHVAFFKKAHILLEGPMQSIAVYLRLHISESFMVILDVMEMKRDQRFVAIATWRTVIRLD